MKRLFLVFLFLLGCDSALSPGATPPEAERGIPEWVAPNFRLGDPENPPRFEKARIRFKPGQTLRTGQGWATGQQYLISFMYRIDPALLRPGSRFALARWRGPAGELFRLDVDARSGVTFLGRSCVPRSDLGGWQRFDMRVKWADDATGFLEVRCHGDLFSGTPVFAASDVATTGGASCVQGGGCPNRAAVRQGDLSMELGLIPRTGALPQGGVVMQRIVERQIFVVFGRVSSLADVPR